MVHVVYEMSMMPNMMPSAPDASTPSPSVGTVKADPVLSTPTKVYDDLIRNVGDNLTDDCLKVITAECLSLLQSVRKIETLCLSSYNTATAGAAMIAANVAANITNTQGPI
jgi:hypothetical protein